MQIKSNRIFIILVLLSCSHICKSQLPKTDIYIASCRFENKTPRITSIDYASDFNPKGYNNQPSFLSSDIIFISVGIDSSNKTDIYKLDTKSNDIYQITDSPDISEFSPTKIPEIDYFSTVRIEADGQTQTLWSYPLSQTNKGKRLFPKLKNVGYYTWISKDIVAINLVGKESELILANITTEKHERIALNVGRTLKYDGKDLLYYLQKSSAGIFNITTYSIKEKATETIVAMPFLSEDFELLSNNSLLLANKSKLYVLDLENTQPIIKEVADLENLGIKGIERLSMFRNKLVFINKK